MPNDSPNCPSSMASFASSHTSHISTLQEKEPEAQHPSTLAEQASLEAPPSLSVKLPPPSSSVQLPPPNGGLLAWMQVAASFCIFFDTWYILSHTRDHVCARAQLTRKQGHCEHVRRLPDLLFLQPSVLLAICHIMDRVRTSISSLPCGSPGWTYLRLRIRAIVAHSGLVPECVWFVHDEHLPRLLAIPIVPGSNHRSGLWMPFPSRGDDCVAVFQY